MRGYGERRAARAVRRTSRRRSCVAACALAISLAAMARADLYVSDMWDNGNAAIGGVIFPNWQRVLVEDATVLLTLGATGSPENITGLTIVNFGSATNADIQKVYVLMACGAT